MKTLILTVLFIPLVIVTSFQSNVKRIIHKEKKVSKNISLAIASENNYNSEIYEQSTATLNVAVLKLKGNMIDTLLSKSYPQFRLNSLNDVSKNFSQLVHVPDVVDSKEQIVIYYDIVYQSKDGVLSIPNAFWVPKGKAKNKLVVNI